MIIEKLKNSIVFNKDGVKYVYPLNAVFLIANDNSDIIVVRLRASRKNVLSFNWIEVNNVIANSPTEMLEQISLLSNDYSTNGGGGVTEEDEQLITEINNIIG